ncbi:MAG: prepilin-type N-terminal cleavage/methylation domain-containing protein [Magnetococcus sp. DMHC-8]
MPRTAHGEAGTGADRRSGFTLLEIAIVLLVVGLLLGSGITSYTAQRDNSQRQRGQVHLDSIRQALIGYVISYGRLPCPNTNGDGQEGDCTALIGLLPWRDLGVQRLDPHGNHFTYHASANYTVGIALPTVGNLDVYDNQYDSANPGDHLLAADVPVVVVSHGRNGRGRYQPNTIPLTRMDLPVGNELENANDDTIYLQGAGDDLLLWLSPAELKLPLQQAGRI